MHSPSEFTNWLRSCIIRVKILLRDFEDLYQPPSAGLSPTHQPLCYFSCSPGDAGEYTVTAKSPLGEATTFATLIVNCE